jgi:hypothetical protein
MDKTEVSLLWPKNMEAYSSKLHRINAAAEVNLGLDELCQSITDNEKQCKIIKEIFFQFIGKTALNNDLITIFEMILFTVTILLICKKRNINLSIFPDIQSKSNKIVYFIVTIIVLFLIISTPVFNGGLSYDVIIPLILSTLATPIFEELIFRGYVWNEFKHYYTNEFTIILLLH